MGFGGNAHVRTIVCLRHCCWWFALVFAELVPVAVAAEDVATAEQPAAALGAQPNPTLPSSAAAAPSPSAPDASAPGAATPPSQSTAASPMPAADPVIASIRGKLGDASLRKGADVKDLAALEAFYAERSDPPVWITGMGSRPRRKLPSTRLARRMTGG